MTRISSVDDDYITGDLSLFSPESRRNLIDPRIKDTKDSLYTASNNAETKLRSGLSYNGKIIIVEDATSFPTTGLVRIGPPPGKEGAAELVYYGSRTNDTFKQLIRGFAGSRQNQWPAQSWATNSVTAEPHNAVKDALINIQKRSGTKELPEEGSLNQRLNTLEARFLAPKASFKAFPRRGTSPLKVKFQNFSEGNVIRYLWDFGDGSQSIEKNPTHTYQSEGEFTVKLSIITDRGAQGTCNKSNYISISNENRPSFFYVTPSENGLSRQTSPDSPTVFRFIDQTDGLIKQRIWIFGDEEPGVVQNDPNVHEINHTYEKPGIYDPSLLVVFANERLKRIYLTNRLEVK